MFNGVLHIYCIIRICVCVYVYIKRNETEHKWFFLNIIILNMKYIFVYYPFVLFHATIYIDLYIIRLHVRQKRWLFLQKKISCEFQFMLPCNLIWIHTFGKCFCSRVFFLFFFFKSFDGSAKVPGNLHSTALIWKMYLVSFLSLVRFTFSALWVLCSGSRWIQTELKIFVLDTISQVWTVTRDWNDKKTQFQNHSTSKSPLLLSADIWLTPPLSIALSLSSQCLPLSGEFWWAGLKWDS